MTVAEYREVVSSDEARAALREAVAEDLEKGEDRETIMAVLDYLRRRLRDEGREEEENAVMDVMDYMVGWSNPRMRL